MGQGPCLSSFAGQVEALCTRRQAGPREAASRTGCAGILRCTEVCHWCLLAENASAGTQQFWTGQHSKPFGQPGLFPPTVGREQEAPEVGEGGAGVLFFHTGIPPSSGAPLQAPAGHRPLSLALWPLMASLPLPRNQGSL